MPGSLTRGNYSRDDNNNFKSIFLAEKEHSVKRTLDRHSLFEGSKYGI